MVLDRHERISRAKKLLAESDAPMYEIAKSCGFARQERLNHTFKRLTGMTPGAFRQQGATETGI